MRHVIATLGEERFAGPIAREIVRTREVGPLTRTGALAALVARVVRTREPGKHPATRTFQALRIFINEELSQIERGLAQALDLLAPQGRLAAISFHSLEDRLVKEFIRRHSEPDPRSRLCHTCRRRHARRCGALPGSSAPRSMKPAPTHGRAVRCCALQKSCRRDSTAQLAVMVAALLWWRCSARPRPPSIQSTAHASCSSNSSVSAARAMSSMRTGAGCSSRRAPGPPTPSSSASPANACI